MKTLLMTDYFRNDVLVKRAYLRVEWCAEAIAHPLRRDAYSTVIRPLIPRTFGHPVHGDPATDSMNIRPAIPR